LERKDGVYFQYWNTATGAPAFNDGADGLERLDYVIAKAHDLGLTVAISLVNNWGDFGGMDQYLAWFGKTYHDEFYTDATIAQAYKDWVAHLLNRTNTISHVVYKDDPAIFAWELANEPRCIGANGHDRATPGGGWSTALITSWAGTMSAYIKSIDANHLVAVGDEGFFDHAGSGDWAYQGEGGVDHEALMALANVDYGTFHLYPDNWTKTVSWGTQWIVDHCAAAAAAGKPTVLGEFGYQVPLHSEPQRMAAYVAWGDALRSGGGDGSWVWMLAGYDPGPVDHRYPDYDHFTVYLDGAPWQAGDAQADDDDVIAAQARELRRADNRTPVAVAVVTPTALAVVCDGSGSSDPDGQALSHAWDFGDGASGTGVAPSHLYAVAGTYTVTLTVSDPYGETDSATQLVTVAASGSGSGGSAGGGGGGGGGGCGLGSAVASLALLVGFAHRRRTRPGA
jgi:hypothetical protein